MMARKRSGRHAGGSTATPPGGQVRFITAAATDGERLVAFYRMLNPDKLRYVETPAASAP